MTSNSPVLVLFCFGFLSQKKETQEARKKARELEKQEVQKLELLIESARVKQRAFLNVDEPWTEENRRSFTGVLSNYHSKRGRELCCTLIGLTPAKVKSASAPQLQVFATNLAISSANQRTDILKFIRKLSE